MIIRHMLRIALLLPLIALIVPKAYAEYDGWHLGLDFVTSDAGHVTGHVYVTEGWCRYDSLDDPAYLLRCLDRSDFRENDTLIFYHERIDYRYLNQWGGDTMTAYTLVGRDSIAIADIVSIRITGKIRFGYLMGISSSHTVQDTAWMMKEPVQSLMVGGYFCEWQVFIHQRTPGTDRIVAELGAIDRKHQEKLKELNAVLEARNEFYDEAAAELERLEEGLDERMTKILQEFQGQKVVIIAFCSC